MCFIDLTSVFVVGHFILVIVFIWSTDICNNFYFIIVVNVNFSHHFSFSRRKYVVLLLVVVLFQLSQLFMDILLNVLHEV